MDIYIGEISLTDGIVHSTYTFLDTPMSIEENKEYEDYRMNDPQVSKILHLLSQLTNDSTASQVSRQDNALDHILHQLQRLVDLNPPRHHQAHFNDLEETITGATAQNNTDGGHTALAITDGEKHFRNIFEQAAVGMCYADLNGHFLRVNQKLCDITGYTQEELGDMNFQEITHPDDLAIDLDYVSQALAGTIQTYSMEKRYYNKNGAIVWINLTVSLARDTQNNPEYFIGVIEDITAHKRAKDALRKSEELYRTIVETAQEGIWLIDNQALTTYVNPKMAEMFGYSPDEMLGRSLYEFMDDAGRQKAERNMERRRLGIEETHEFRFKHKDGKDVWTTMATNPIMDDQGRLISALAMVTDITERKQMETALREREALLQEAVRVGSIGIFDHDHFNDTLYWSPEQRQIHGWGPDEPVSLAVFLEIVHPDDIEWVGKAVQRAHDPEGDGLFDVEYRIIRRDGETRWTNVRSHTFFEGEGSARRPVRTVGALMDTTERKRIEAEIRKLNEQLEQRVRERTQQLVAVNSELESFAYSVSHDLRAPLRSIDGFSQALLEDYHDRLDAEGQDFLNRVRQATLRMGNLIDDLLRLSRVARREMQLQTVDLSEIVGQIVTELHDTQPQRAVKWIIMPSVLAQGDRGLLFTALENLLRNAWKFTSKNEYTRIEFGYEEREGEHVYFVRDNGVGFDMKYADKLFGAFQRLHHQDEFDGTGIGLATVQRIIRRHGGRLWAEGVVDQGATFFFTV